MIKENELDYAPYPSDGPTWEQDSAARRDDLDVARGMQRARLKLGMTKVQLARHLGCSERTLANYEAGICPVPSDKLALLLKCGRIRYHEIFGSRPDPIDHDERNDLIDLACQIISGVKQAYPEAEQCDVEHYVKHALREFPDPKKVTSEQRRECVQLCVYLLNSKYCYEYDESWDRPELPTKKRRRTSVTVKETNSFSLASISPFRRRGRPPKRPDY